MQLDRIEIKKGPHGTFVIKGYALKNTRFMRGTELEVAATFEEHIWTDSAATLQEAGEKIVLCSKGVHIW